MLSELTWVTGRKERRAASIVLGRSGGQLSQWPRKVREVAGAEHLNTGVVFAIEARDRSRAPRRHGGLWRAKPQPEVERMDRLRGRVCCRIREGWLVMHDRSWLVAGGLRDDERLDVEAPPEPLVTFSLIISLDVTLIPG